MTAVHLMSEPETSIRTLRTAVREEFLVDIYVPRIDDLVLWGPPCAVAGCPGGMVPIGKARRPGSTHGNRLPQVCSLHIKRWYRSGKPAVDVFTREQATRPHADEERHTRLYAFDMEDLVDPLKLEFQFALQMRHLEQRARLFSKDFRAAATTARASGVTSLLDRPSEYWRVTAPSAGSRSFLRYAYEGLRDFFAPPLMEQDIWAPSLFPNNFARSTARLRFDGFQQLWLRDAAKRWMKYRLDCGVRWATACSNLAGVRAFDQFLSQQDRAFAGMNSLCRDDLLGFVGFVRAEGRGTENWISKVSGVRLFLDDYRTNGWEPELRSTVLLRRNEAPRRPEALPKPVDEFVMRQLEAIENLERLPLYYVALLLIGIRQGLRASDVLSLAFEPLREDSNGQWALNYDNGKAERDVVMPVIHPEVITLIRAQQQAVLERFPAGSPWLFPKAQSNPHGQERMPYATLRSALRDWLELCQIATPAGRRAKITFHQFRHTFATRLITAGMPEHVVQRLLDHRDARTTRGYAQMSSEVQREQFFKFSRIDNRGREIRVDPDSPLADAEWIKEQMNRTKVSLPNGYCALPLQQECEMRNACIDCDAYFVTTSEFLPVHDAQLASTRKLIATADANGQFRLAEKNRKLETKLVAIVDRLRDMDCTNE